MNNFIETIEKLLFSKTDTRIYAIIRIGLAMFALWGLIEHLSIGIFNSFSIEGWSHINTPIFFASGTPLGINLASISLFHFFNSNLSVGLTFIVLGLSILSILIGFYSKIGLGIFVIIWLSMLNHNPALEFVGDRILLFLAYVLLFSQPDSNYTLFKRAKGVTEASVFPLRLMQFYFIQCYFINGLVKLLGSDWWTGQALVYVLNNPLYSRFILGELGESVMVKWILTLPAWVILFWQSTYPVFYFFKKTRIAIIIVSVVVHLGIYLLMIHSYFGPLMMFTALIHLPEESIKLFEKGLSLVKSKICSFA